MDDRQRDLFDRFKFVRPGESPAPAAVSSGPAAGTAPAATAARPAKAKPVRDTAGATRREAVAKIESKAPTLRERVFQFIESRGSFGATDEEIMANTGLKEGTARARRVELRDAGRIRDSGLERQTASGRGATVWIVPTVGGEASASAGGVCGA